MLKSLRAITRSLADSQGLRNTRSLNMDSESVWYSSGQTKQGIRNATNQDAWLALPTHRIFAVCDGMGGHNGGEIASQMAVNLLFKCLSEARCDIDRIYIREALQYVNRQIYTRASCEPELSGMGATIVLAWIQGGKLILFHSGDSRAYRIRQYTLKQLTCDHTEYYQDDNIYIRGKGRLTNALGVRPFLEIDESDHEWMDGDELLLLTDGIFDVLHHFEIANIVVEHSEFPINRVKKLLQKSEERAGRDDKTAVLVFNERI